MTKLLHLQQKFARHIFIKSDRKILDQINHSDVEALSRLDIYRNNVLGNFESILSDIFRITKKIVGEKEFSKLIKKYCLKFPSKSGDLNEFGIEFPNFIKSSKPSYLKDLARLELLYHQSYFTAQITKELDVKKFQKLPEEKFFDLIFTLNPSTILFSSKFKIFSIWQKEKNLKNIANEEFALIFNGKIFQLKKEEFLFLSLITKKNNLYKIYQKLCRETKKKINIGTLINKFVSSGVIIDFCLAKK